MINFKYFTKFKSYLDYFIKGLFAGIIICLGTILYLNSNNKVLGCIFISVSLLIVVMYGMHLFSFKAGYLVSNKKNYLSELITNLIGNFVGIFVTSKVLLLTNLKVKESAVLLANNILNDDAVSVFILSLFCGIFLYITFNNYKKINTEIGKYSMLIILPIIFMMANFHHSINVMSLFILGNIWSIKALLYMIVILLGNLIGSVIISYFYNLYYKN